MKGAGDSQLTKQKDTGEMKKNNNKVLYCATEGAGYPVLLKGVIIIVAERRSSQIACVFSAPFPCLLKELML